MDAPRRGQPPTRSDYNFAAATWPTHVIVQSLAHVEESGRTVRLRFYLASAER